MGKYGDLLTTNPLLAKEWDYEKNEISPDKVSKGTHLKVWWKCSKCNYSWEAKVYSRCSGIGCPQCARKVFGDYKIALDRKKLFPVTITKAKRLLPDLEYDGYGYTSVAQSVGITVNPDNEDRIDGILFGCANYYSE